jgi:Fe2+ transport system protein FeoA
MVARQMPLAMVAPQESVTVVNVRAGRGLTQRLADMGLTPGASLKKVSDFTSGPLIIELRGSRVALGHGVAQKIMVKRADDA